MLLWLTERLTEYIGGFGVFQYLTFRTMVSVTTALAISLLIGPLVIERLTHHQIGQRVRDDGPQSHFSKAGTPTMGGALILIVILFTTLAWGDLSNRYIWVALSVTMAFGVISTSIMQSSSLVSVITINTSYIGQSQAYQNIEFYDR